jgi:Parkin co-regulated protein
LREKIDPYRFLSISAAFEMIEKGTSEQLAAVIPQLILPFKSKSFFISFLKINKKQI